MENDTATEVVAFELNDTIIRKAKATYRGKKLEVTHELRGPTFTELDNRDAAQPYRAQDIGNEEEEVLSDVSGKADAKLYDKLIVSTEGYKTNLQKEMSEEDKKDALLQIPHAHKTSIIRAILTYPSEIVYDDDVDVDTFSWSEDQTYRVRTEIGDTGNFVVFSDIKEPSQKQIDDYTGAIKYVIEKGHKKPVTRITVGLAPAVKLFDALVKNIEGFTVDGNPFDANNKQHLALVNGYIKRSIIDKVMKETRLDLGN
jgi:hypothetical protein